MPFIDGLPAATVVNASDLILVDQGGTAGVPGTATTRTALVSQFNAGLGAYMPLSGGTFNGAVAHGANLLSGSNVAVTGGTVVSSTLTGTTTNDNAGAGILGEYQTASTLGTSLTTSTPTQAASISLTAGDWDVWGSIAFVPAGTTTVQQILACIALTVALPASSNPSYLLEQVSFTTGANQNRSVGNARFSLATTTTVFLVAQAGFGVSTMTVNGYLYARRVR